MKKTRKHPDRKMIALEAGVSVSTVDRVLNERESVSPERRKRVVDAARKLKAKWLLPETWHKTAHIELILPRNHPTNFTPFWSDLDKLALSYARYLPKNIVLHRTQIPETDTATLIDAIRHPRFHRDALIIAAAEDDPVIPALNEAIARGEHVVTIVNDVRTIRPHLYCGVDSYSMGRTAGALMRKCIRGEGRILLLQASQKRHEHRQRIEGFLDALSDFMPCDVHVTDESTDITRDMANRALARGDIRGIYMTGHTPEALQQLLRQSSQPPLWIGHELSMPHARLLHDGLMDFVIDQDAESQISSALAAVISKLHPEQDLHFFVRDPEFRIYSKESMPKKMQEII